MKRIGIFCLYTLTGETDSAVWHTLMELRSVVEYLVVVVNGLIHNKLKLYEYADEIYIRENSGYDIGAYKSILLSPDYVTRIKNSDELILCNSSFYGPFIPLRDIFEKMENSHSDFWGISSSEKNLVKHIQSFFLVFRRSVLEGTELFRYLEERVDENKIDYFDACSIFENGLFWTLEQAGYKFDAYRRDICCNNYLNPYGSVKLDGLPILKKKIFSEEFYEKERVVNALSYVKDIFEYDISSILEDAYRTYGIEVFPTELKNTEVVIAKADLFQRADMVHRNEIEEFLKSQKTVWIYGNGMMAQNIYSGFFFYENNPKLEGFIVSNNQLIEERRFKGYPVYKISELDSIQNKAILVALNKENTKEITGYLRKVKDVKFLWR